MKRSSSKRLRQSQKQRRYLRTVRVKAECYEAIELKLIPLGVSGIEDLLQDEVFETIDVSE